LGKKFLKHLRYLLIILRIQFFGWIKNNIVINDGVYFTPPLFVNQGKLISSCNQAQFMRKFYPASQKGFKRIRYAQIQDNVNEGGVS